MSLPRFGVTRPVPVNLLMVAILLAGAIAAMSIRREFFPESDPEACQVTMPYPGATPEEIEATLVRKVEDKVDEIEEVDELLTSISEGVAIMTVNFEEGTKDIDKAIRDVERAIDSLLDLPEDAEEITVTEFETKIPVIMVSLYGDTDEETLKQTVRRVRDDLQSLPGMGDIVFSGVRDYELRVDVDESALLAHGISLPQVANAISAWMADVPGGSIRSEVGSINVRTIGIEEDAEAIRNIVVKSTPDGQSLRVSDIATVTETFVDEIINTRFNAKPSATMTIFKFGGQDIISMARMVKNYVAGMRGEDYPGSALAAWAAQTGNTDAWKAWDLGRNGLTKLPRNTNLSVHSDWARLVDGRMKLLIENAFFGALLVFATLLIFLNWRGAFWVGVGLVTAMAGTLVLMHWLDVTLNLLTMFGLIIVIGLLVDDAIVVAENVQARHDDGESSLVAAIGGTEQVSWPVVATVLTSIVAFLPLTFLKGQIGTLLGALPTVVACALIMSLIESLLILPSHLGHSLVHRDKKTPGRVARALQRFERARDRVIFQRIVPAYAKVLKLALRYRYSAVAIATSVFIISIGMLMGGKVRYVFLPDSDAETVLVNIRMPIGASPDQTTQVARAIELAAGELQNEVTSVSTLVGVSIDVNTGNATGVATHIAQLFIELADVESRDRESNVIIDDIRSRVEEAILPAEQVVFEGMSGGPSGADITLNLRSEDEVLMRDAAEVVKQELAQFQGVHDIADDNSLGQRELQIYLLPEAAPLGLTVADVANQVRGALFGLDAHVFSDREEDIDVRVRLDEQSRQSLFNIENLWIITPRGERVPLQEVAQVTDGESYATIRRIDRKRSVTVTANVAPGVSSNEIMLELPFVEWRDTFPGVVIEQGGQQEQQKDAFSSLPIGFGAAVVMIYVILAWLFSSYVQPLAVMIGIPFALIGVIWGHLLLGFEMTFLSIIGFVALSGIVVNDSLILVKFYNDLRRDGMDLIEALVESGKQRFRPIMLTTITTILGLTPLMLEQSFQAKFLIPMAISIAFGLMSATFLILLMLPCILVIFDDIRGLLFYLWHGRPRERNAIAHPTIADVTPE